MVILSEPHPKGVPRRVMRAASPPELPPGVCAELNGLELMPKMGLEHSKARRACGTLVLQNGIPPAWRKSLTS